MFIVVGLAGFIIDDVYGGIVVHDHSIDLVNGPSLIYYLLFVEDCIAAPERKELPEKIVIKKRAYRLTYRGNVILKIVFRRSGRYKELQFLTTQWRAPDKRQNVMQYIASFLRKHLLPRKRCRITDSDPVPR